MNGIRLVVTKNGDDSGAEEISASEMAYWLNRFRMTPGSEQEAFIRSIPREYRRGLMATSIAHRRDYLMDSYAAINDEEQLLSRLGG